MRKKDPDKLSEQLSAYLDDELSDRERRAVERALGSDAEALAQLDGLRHTVEAVRSLPREHAPDSLVGDLTAAAERRQLLDDPGRARAATGGARPWRALLATAAAVLVVGPAAWWMFGREGVPPAERSLTTSRGIGQPFAADDARTEPEAAPPEGAKLAALEKQFADARRDLGVDRQLAARGAPEGPGRSGSGGGQAFKGGPAAEHDKAAIGGTAAPEHHARDEIPGRANTPLVGPPAELAAAPADPTTLLAMMAAPHEPIVLNVTFAGVEARNEAAGLIDNFCQAQTTVPPTPEAGAKDRTADAIRAMARAQGDTNRTQIAVGDRPVQVASARLVTATDGCYVVQVAREQLPAWLDTVTHAASDAGDLELSYGEIRARGREQVIESLRLGAPTYVFDHPTGEPNAESAALGTPVTAPDPDAAERDETADDGRQNRAARAEREPHDADARKREPRGRGFADGETVASAPASQPSAQPGGGHFGEMAVGPTSTAASESWVTLVINLMTAPLTSSAPAAEPSSGGPLTSQPAEPPARGQP